MCCNVPAQLAVIANFVPKSAPVLVFAVARPDNASSLQTAHQWPRSALTGLLWISVQMCAHLILHGSVEPDLRHNLVGLRLFHKK